MDLFQRLEAERNRTGQNETLDTPESSQAKPNAQAPRGLDQTTVSEPKVIPAAGAPKVEAT